MTWASALGMCPMRARGRNAPLILEGVQRWRLKPNSNPLGQGHLTSCQPVASPFASLATTVKCRIKCRRIMVDFYRAMLCIRGTSHGPVSVCLCLSQAGVLLKRQKRRITQTTPHDTPGTLVFWCQRSPWNSTGVTPYEGAECRWGG